MDMESAKRLREAADNRDAAFRIVLGAAGSDFLGLRDRLTQEPTCKEFALVDDQRRSLRTDSFRKETKGWRASPATAALLVKSLDAPANSFLSTPVEEASLYTRQSFSTPVEP